MLKVFNAVKNTSIRINSKVYKKSKTMFITQKRYHPCRTDDYDDAYRVQKEIKIKEDKVNNKKLELDLCRANSLLYKFSEKKQLTNSDKGALTELLNEHKIHRKKDIRAEMKEYETEIDQLEFAIVNSNNLIENSRKRLKIIREKLSTLKKIDLYKLDFLDRNE